jgi:hypothetical protein
MSHFYGSMQGGRSSEVTRTGTKNSGMSAHIRTWDFGVIVEIENRDGLDVVRVHKTGGSNNEGNQELVTEFVK